jgi:hypothetical protein
MSARARSLRLCGLALRLSGGNSALVAAAPISYGALSCLANGISSSRSYAVGKQLPANWVLLRQVS